MGATTLLKWIAIPTIVIVVFSSIFVGPVTELPFGMQPYLVTFSLILNELVQAIPWLEAPFAVIIYVILFQILMITVKLATWLIELYYSS